METVLTVFKQIIKMFLMMMVGYYLYRKKVLNDDATSRLSSILLMVATPCTLINSFFQVYSKEKLIGWFIALCYSFLSFLVGIIIAKLIYKDKAVEKFSVIFSNAGFLGIPLVTGLLGSQMVFYLSTYIVGFYLLAWTLGVKIMNKDEDISFKKIITNPCVFAVFIGFFIFVLSIDLWQPFHEAISSLAGLNTPLAMIVLGAYLAKSPLKDMIKNKTAYKVSFVRLIVVPLIVMFILTFIPLGSTEIKLTVLIAASAPVAALVPMFAQMYNQDISLGAHIVSISTVLSLLSMPLIVYLAGVLGL